MLDVNAGRVMMAGAHSGEDVEPLQELNYPGEGCELQGQAGASWLPLAQHQARL